MSGDDYVPVPLTNVEGSCPTSTTVQCIASTPLMSATFLSLEAGQSGDALISSINVVLGKVLARQMPTAGELWALHSAFRALCPVAETSVDIYDDASRFADFAGNAAG